MDLSSFLKVAGWTLLAFIVLAFVIGAWVMNRPRPACPRCGQPKADVIHRDLFFVPRYGCQPCGYEWHEGEEHINGGRPPQERQAEGQA